MILQQILFHISNMLIFVYFLHTIFLIQLDNGAFNYSEKNETEYFQSLARRQVSFTPCRAFGRNYFYLQKTLKTFRESKLACSSIRMNLTRIYSQKHWEFLEDFWSDMGRGIFWIGVTDERIEGKWRHYDGVPIVYQDWQSGRPDKSRDNQNDCVVMGSGGSSKWLDVSCEDSHYSICESKHFACNPGSIDGEWSKWESTPCSVTCGNGTYTMTRRCDSPAPFNGGRNCADPNNNSMTIDCYTYTDCPVNGNWSPWGQWMSCSASCGGTREAYRDCNNPAPIPPGAPCPGNDTKIEFCVHNTCNLAGSWGKWGVWSDCSATCNNGKQTRTRKCDSPPPMGSGDPCSTKHFGDTDEKICKIKECPIDGNWGSWDYWTPCSVSCGMGKRSRSRQCDSPSPQYGGANCPDEPTNQVEPCIDKYCPGVKSWTVWSVWSQCTKSCGSESSKERRRLCISPPGKVGVGTCKGNGLEVRSCYMDPCPKRRTSKKQKKKDAEKEAQSRTLLKIILISVGALIGVFLLMGGAILAMRNMDGRVAYASSSSSSDDEEEEEKMKGR